MHRVVVLGAGYAGLPAVNRLARQTYRDEVEVVLISERDHFVERPRLHQVATGQTVKHLPLTRFLRQDVRFVQAHVEAIDTDTHGLKTASVEGIQFVEYDTLLYALGSAPDVDSVPGVRDHALHLSNPESAWHIANALQSKPDAQVNVCGGGLTGLETATEVAENYPRAQVKLLTDGRVAGWLNEKASTYTRKALHELDVEVIEHTRVRQLDPHTARTNNGDHTFDIAIWAGGFNVPRLAAEAGIRVDDRGRVITNESLQSVSASNIYAAGDAAAVPGPWGPALAMGCRTGGFTAPTAADSILAGLTGRQAPTFKFRYFHECISLGRQRAVIQFLRADGEPSTHSLRGRLAVGYKNVILNSARIVFGHPGPLLPRRRHIRSPSLLGG